MIHLRYADLVRKPLDVLDMTGLTLNEFQLLLPAFEQAFQAHMPEWRLYGKPLPPAAFPPIKTARSPRPKIGCCSCWST